jgi:monoamine oxidase
MLALARQFGLTVEDLYRVPYPGRGRLWLKGALRSRAELAPQRRLLDRTLVAAARRVRSYRYDDATPAARAMDELSVEDWLDRSLPGGSSSLTGHLVWAQMAGEFGLDADRLSALNLLYEYVHRPVGADERYHVAGGNDQVVTGLYERLPDGTVTLDSPLEALWTRSDGSIGMRFGGTPDDVVADRVVLTLPFTNLREVDLSGARLSRRKRACIAELGMGTNAKLLMQFERRPSRYGDWSGSYLTDNPYYWTWQSSVAEPGRAGLITFYSGGRSGGAGVRTPDPHMPAPAPLVREVLATLDRGGATGIDGIAAGFNGRAWVDHWAADPWVRGSYAAFLPGQYTRYYGFVAKPEVNIHFGGEHTALLNQGYLEGAVESGERCAKEVQRAVAGG